MQQRSRKPKPLLLPARQVARLFLKLCLQTILRIQKRHQVHAPKHRTHLRFRRVRLRHLEVLFYRSLEQIAVMPHQRHVFHQRRFPDIPDRNSTDRHASAESAVFAGQNFRDRTLAAA